MIKKTETIQVRLTNYGTIEVVSIPTRIYKDSYNVMRLSCIVPKVEETGARICKVYATDVDEAGNTIFTSQAHFLPQLREKDGSEKIIKINGFDYIIYEDRLPEEFCKDTGNITLNFAEGIIDGENEIVRNNVSGQLNLFISGDGYNYNGVRISNYDVVASRIDAIYKTSENALKVAQDAVDAVVEAEGSKIKLDGEFIGVWNADFAESERQKSKNLWAYGDVSGTRWKDTYLTQPLPAGTYTFSAVATSTDTSSNYALVEFYDVDGTYIKGEVILKNERASFTVTLNRDCYKISCVGTPTATVGGTFTFTNIMITTDGSTDYQQYNGAIVHEKDIADVEHVETIYDYASTDTNKNWGYSNGLKGGTTIENVNFSKYKKVKIYCAWFNAALQPIVIDFSVVTDASVVGTAIYKNDTDTRSITCTIQDKNKFKVNAGYSYNSGTPVLENTDYFVVKKIEGVY